MGEKDEKVWNMFSEQTIIENKKHTRLLLGKIGQVLKPLTIGTIKKESNMAIYNSARKG